MPENRDSQLLKGVLPMLILASLSQGETYGYELVTTLQAAGLIDISPGSVYPALTRLERAGAVSARLVPSNAGPARKYYTLTASGRASLTDSAHAWRTLSATVDPLLASIPTTKEL